MNPIEKADAAVWQAIAGERRRQQTGLEMIASENYTRTALLRRL
jgi:glycine hydroxymethyltransferase